MELLKIRKALESIMKEETKNEFEIIRNATKFESGRSREGYAGKTKAGKWVAVSAELTEREKASAKNLQEQKQKLRAKVLKAKAKELAKQFAKLAEIEAAEIPHGLELSLDWTNSRTWGANARGTMWTYCKQRGCKRFEGSRTTGCGYDKHSTAAASCLNQEAGILRAIYEKLNKQPAAKIKTILNGGDARDVFGYGLHFWKICRPFEGGVGISSTLGVLQGLGYKQIAGSSGKNYDYYKLEA